MALNQEDIQKVFISLELFLHDYEEAKKPTRRRITERQYSIVRI